MDDVADDPIFRGTKSKEIVLGEGVRAVQSIPLTTASGKLVGVVFCLPTFAPRNLPVKSSYRSRMLSHKNLPS
jgi:hypothetical protein